MTTLRNQTINVNQHDNDEYFDQKLPTWSKGYCEIVRLVTLETDPHEVYGEGEYGSIKTPKGKVFVTRCTPSGNWDIKTHGNVRRATR